MKKMLISLCCCILVLTGCSSSKKKGVLNVGIIQQVDHPALENAMQGFIDYFSENGIVESKIEFTIKNAQGDTGTNDTIAKQFAADNYDLVYAVGTNSALSAANATTIKQIPVIFNAVTDPVKSKLVASLNKPGAHISGVSDAAPLEKQIELIKEFLPNVAKIGMIYNTGEINGKLQVDTVIELAKAMNIEVISKGVSQTSDVAIAAQQLCAEVDCIYNITDNMIVNATASIVDKANAKNIPVFAAEDGQMASGILASESINYYNLGKQAGEMAYKILFDKVDPKDLPVETAAETTLFVNQSAADKLNIAIPESINQRATILEK